MSTVTTEPARRLDIGDDVDDPAAADDLERLAVFLLDELRMSDGAQLSISLVDEEAMAALHVEWMDEPGPTDVLSFPLDELREPAPHEEPPTGVLGDVVLCPAVARRQAVVAGHSPEHELRVLLTHGVLHLLGHDHAEPDEEQIMFSRQTELVAKYERLLADGGSVDVGGPA
jgi:probable rRNA maturation factor